MDLCTEDRFLEDVKDHRMSIIRLDGSVNRHIRFKKPDSSYYYFDLITWAGHLCITGDCGTYVFARTEDMFDFFQPPKNKPLKINPAYWAEKVLAEDRCRKVEKFSIDKFKKAVKSDFETWFEDSDNKKKRKECWEEIESQLEYVSSEWEAVDFISTFSFEGDQFEDFWEHRINEYTFGYIWNLYAIVWGISQYNQFKTKVDENIKTDIFGYFPKEIFDQLMSGNQ